MTVALQVSTDFISSTKLLHDVEQIDFLRSKGKIADSEAQRMQGALKQAMAALPDQRHSFSVEGVPLDVLVGLASSIVRLWARRMLLAYCLQFVSTL